MRTTISHSRQINRCAAGLLVLLAAVSSSGEEPSRTAQKPNSATAAPNAPNSKADELSPQTKEIVGWTGDMAKEIGTVIESWLSNGTTTQERLFSYLYYPVTNTEPTKYSTDYDTFSDRDFPVILEKYFAKSSTILYAVAMDRNGYVPTHNRQYSQPLTGNRAMDLVNNRTKRIFGDQIAFKAARNQKPFYLQSYSRDTGELAVDVSVPITIRGRHWGCVRIGFRAVDAR